MTYAHGDGDHTTQVAPTHAQLTGGKCSLLVGGKDTWLAGGLGSTLIFLYKDSRRGHVAYMRAVVAYIGEECGEPGKFYRLNDDHFIVEAEEDDQ